MTDQPEFEELEHIPWAALAAKRPDPRLRLGALAIATVALIAVMLLAAKGLVVGGDTTDTVPPTTDVVLSTETTVELIDDEVSPVAASPAAALYSEADLMLISIEDEERLAVMQAEWFVRDYFTIDGDESIAQRVAALVPEDTPAPLGQTSSYVEWVRAFAVESISPGRYRVEVVYRLLIGAGDGFVREPVGAVAVDLSVDIEGSAMLLSIPEAITVPVLFPMEAGAG